MAEGYIKLYSKMLKWEWYDDINTKVLFLHCLLRANWKSGSWHGINYNAGEFITSLSTLAQETKLSVRQVRVALEHLKMTGEVTDRRQANCRIITVVKWNEYQCYDRLDDIPVTDQRQTCDRPVTADKEYKNIRIKEYKNIKEKNIKEKPVYYPNDETLNEKFTAYVEMRKKIRAPMTDNAIGLAIKKLDKLSGGDSEKAIAILEQSIMNSWRGLFEVKEWTKKQNDSIYDKWRNA